MNPEINLNHASYNLTDGEIPTFQAIKDRDAITQEMIELAKVQKQTNLRVSQGYEDAIQETQSMIDNHYIELTNLYRKVKAVLRVQYQ